VKEKRSDWWKAIAGLAVVAVLAVGLGLLFRGQRPTPGTTEPTATCTPTPTTTPVSTATPTLTPALPAGTPLPRRLSQAAPLSAPEGFWLMDLEEDTVVGGIVVNDEIQIVLLDLTTGAVKQVSSATGTDGKGSAHVSGRWVVWTEEVELADRSIERRLKVYDRQEEREFALEAAPHEVDLSGDVVVWEEWRGWENRYDLFAYNLRTGETLSIAERPAAQLFPHISGPWVIYLDLAEYLEEQKIADLRAHHLQSGEDFVLAQVPFPGDASTGTYHAIKGDKVAWVRNRPDFSKELHVYDLTTRTDHPMPSLYLFGDVLVPLVGSYAQGWPVYNLETGDLLGTVEILPLNAEIDTLFVSGDRVAWETIDEVGVRRSYTARVEP